MGHASKEKFGVYDLAGLIGSLKHWAVVTACDHEVAAARMAEAAAALPAIQSRLEKAERERDEAWKQATKNLMEVKCLQEASKAASANVVLLRNRLDVAEALVAELREALKPFADCVFNDNGDVTVDTSNRPTHDDYVQAYFAHRRARAAYEKSGGEDKGG
jgi:septal ring factor EnvC (AmiA/AmiB activator)